MAFIGKRKAQLSWLKVAQKPSTLTPTLTLTLNPNPDPKS